MIKNKFMNMNKKILGLVIVTLFLGIGFVFAGVDGCKMNTNQALKIDTTIFNGVSTCQAALSGIAPNQTCEYTKDSCGICCLMNMVYNITNWVFVILMAIASLMIIWGAVLFTTSSGDPEKTGTARKLIIFAAVGIVVALFSQGIPLVVKFVVGA